MPFDLPIPAVLTLYALVFLIQIYIASIHYPGKMVERARYVLTHFPPETYPKCYPGAQSPNYVANQMKRLERYLAANYVIAGVGLALIGVMIFSGYTPSPKGGLEGVVVLCFMVQAVPLLALSVHESIQHKRMRQAFNETKRSAELKPRRLFDFISPGYVITALAFYCAWLVFYLFANDSGDASPMERLITIGGVTAMNVLFAIAINRYLAGQGANPYHSTNDNNRITGITIRVMVLASIGASLSLIVFQAADTFAFEAFDPIIASLYMQLCLIFGVGELLRNIQVEELDFEVYRREPVSGAS